VRRRFSLRARVLLTLLGLLTLVSAGVGVAVDIALSHFLVQRLDSQLAAAGARSQGGRYLSPGGPPDGDDLRGGRQEGAPGFLFQPGFSAGTLGARVVAGRVTEAGILREDSSSTGLATAEAQALLAVPADDRPHTVTVGSRGQFRVEAHPFPDGTTLITGLPLAGVRATVVRLAVIEIAVAGTGLALAGAAGVALVRVALRPLDRVAHTAQRVTELRLDRGEVALADRVPEADTDVRTEVGQVGAALNRLLGHVQAALEARQASESRVRQFVADASHELRTPLAAIRGYAELTRRRRDEVPPEVAHALRRVESEAERMTSLVDDLLLLARLDSGRPLAHESVDVSRLVLDAVSDAHAAAPDHVWQLDLPEEPVTVSGTPRGCTRWSRTCWRTPERTRPAAPA